MSPGRNIVAERARVRASITKLCNSLTGDLSGLSKLEIAQNISKLENLAVKVKQFDDTFLSTFWDDSDPQMAAKYDAELDQCEIYENKIIDIIAKLKNINTSPIANSAPGSHHYRIKAPEVALPEFSDSDSSINLNKFFSEFEDALSSFNLPDAELFRQLKKAVKGRALSILESIGLQKRSYIFAKDLLLESLANKDALKFEVVKRLINLKFDNFKDPYEYASELRLLQDEIETQNICIESVMQFCFLNSMSFHLKNNIMLMTNNNYPSVKEISDNIFKSIERLGINKSTFKNSKFENPPKNFKNFDSQNNFKKFENKFQAKADSKVNANAANVSFSKDKCGLCTKVNKDFNHAIYKCPNFPTPDSKRNFLKENKGCLKCAQFHSNSGPCDFRFRKPCRCGQWHFGFLCNAQTSENFNDQKKDDESLSSATPKVNNATIWTHGTFRDDASSVSILPTFTCETESSLLCRALKDSGSECTFFKKEFIDKIPHTILKNISLTICGFNNAKKFDTQVVKVNLKINETLHAVRGIIVPDIHTKLSVPNLPSIVKTFKEKNYPFADKLINENTTTIDNINIIWGVDNLALLPENTVVFGNSEPSCFVNTPIGVMLCGDLHTYTNNLEYLPTYASNNIATCLNQKSFQNFSDSDAKFANVDSILVSNYHIVVKEGEFLSEKTLFKAAEHVLDQECNTFLYKDNNIYEKEPNISEINDQVTKYVLNNMTTAKDGRLIASLPWNPRVCHRLGENYHLAKSVLNSNLRKYSKEPSKLKMIDDVITSQLNEDIVEKIYDFNAFKAENPKHSFLSHMPVFRMDKETTKCRVVFLSNICQRDGKDVSISHNQALYAGQNYNNKLLTALLNLRFDRFLLCWDLRRAFLQISLTFLDTCRLLFLWYKNVDDPSLGLDVYKFNRLSFGLSPSPTILILALYKILVLDAENDPEPLKSIKLKIYKLLYMDNLAYSCNDVKELEYVKNILPAIFAKYKFELQQFATNDENVQNSLEEVPRTVKLLGLQWDRPSDTLSNNHLRLDPDACSKRSILRSLASCYDIFNMYLPLLNEAKLFMQNLQIQKGLNWDQKIDPTLIQKWKSIANRFNKVPQISINRYVGRTEENYRLIAASDASGKIVGAVVYIQNVDSLETNFLLAKNKLVNKSLENKSIPCLELHALVFAAELLLDVYNQFVGPDVINPINITDLKVFSDAMIALCWTRNYSVRLEKVPKGNSVFITNRLNKLLQVCANHPINFNFIGGASNPSDMTTRVVSYKALMKSSYFSGDSFKNFDELNFSFTIPNALDSAETLCTEVCTTAVNINKEHEHLIPLNKFSSYIKLIRVHSLILKFINKLKLKVKIKSPEKFKNLECLDPDKTNFFLFSKLKIISVDQKINFPECFDYLDKKVKLNKDMPNLIKQLNIFKDEFDCLKLKSKCLRGKNKNLCYFPILLDKNSELTKLIIKNIHLKNFHVGKYHVLKELRQNFYIPKMFSTVKKCLKSCISCKKLNSQAVKLNQSPYRDFRLNPPSTVYKYIFVDHFGTYTIKYNNEKIKAYILIVVCLWSRSINLIPCLSLNTESFLRAMQLHVFDFGMFECLFSDLGSSIVAGSQIISDFIKDTATQNYLHENNVKTPEFYHYFKGNESLGSCVESCVKISKRLIFHSLGNKVLNYVDFEFLIRQAISIINKRPIAFLPGLRDGDANEDVPEPITPELLQKGYHCLDINLIPYLQPDLTNESEWEGHPARPIQESYAKLSEARSKLIQNYNEEFLVKLIDQAVDRPDRYKPVKHVRLQVGDVVLIKEPLQKPTNYPMGIIQKTFENIQGEITHVIVKKGMTRESLKRHVSQIIYLFSNSPNKNEINTTSNENCSETCFVMPKEPDKTKGHDPTVKRPKREAAIKGAKNLRNLADEDLI